MMYSMLVLEGEDAGNVGINTNWFGVSNSLIHL
jgi:hypothetical protein